MASQNSGSHYSKHNTKLSDLLRHVRCPELEKDKILLEYYWEMTPEVKSKQLIYIYISPQEIKDIDDNELNTTKEKIKLGFVQESTPTAAIIEHIASSL